MKKTTISSFFKVKKRKSDGVDQEKKRAKSNEGNSIPKKQKKLEDMLTPPRRSLGSQKTPEQNLKPLFEGREVHGNGQGNNGTGVELEDIGEGNRQVNTQTTPSKSGRDWDPLLEKLRTPNKHKMTPRITRTPVKKKKDADKRQSRFSFLIKMKDGKMRSPDDPDYDPTTLYISDSELSTLSSMEQQYWKVKKDHFDKILFFKKGKFYEVYEMDADVAHKLFEWKVTKRINMSMAGVPEKSKEHWIRKFVSHGYKVAVVEQVETRHAANQRKKSSIVKRELTEVLTAGTITDLELLSEETKYLLSVQESSENTSNPVYGICFCDLSTGEFNLGELHDDKHRTLFDTLISQINPAEILIEKRNASKQTLNILKNIKPKPQIERLEPYHDFGSAEAVRQFISIQALESHVLEGYLSKDIVMEALGRCFSHLQSVKKLDSVLTMNNFCEYDSKNYKDSMILDGQTLVNLEILKNSHNGGSEGTLFRHICHCFTPFGKRMFKKWILHPVRKMSVLEDRLNAIDDFNVIGLDRKQLKKLLKDIPDLERNLSSINTYAQSTHNVVTFDSNADKKRANLFMSTIQGLKQLMLIPQILQEEMKADQFRSQQMATIANLVEPVEEVVGENEHGQKIVKRFLKDRGFPNMTDVLEDFGDSFNIINDVLVPKKGADQEYDELHKNELSQERKIEEFLSHVREELGSDRISYHQPRTGQLKYLIEIDAKEKIDPPSEYILDTKLKSKKRYRVKSLDSLVSELQTIREAIDERSKFILKHIFQRFMQYYDLFKVCLQLGSLFDCLQSLWTTSTFDEHCRPKFLNQNLPYLRIKNLFHPCLEMKNGTQFIKNDVEMGGSNPGTIVVTGPNMGGKSTLLRQVCIALIMAQIGCYVPASSMEFTLIDRVFTRIGANDRIMSGESTFMVELLETSNVLKHATKNSFVILDELGRGTSTQDGYAIAYAVLNYLAEKIKCLTLFATHYHGLTQELSYHPDIDMYHMDCLIRKDGNSIPRAIFLYKFKPGIGESHGLNTAAMAGLPESILRKAHEVSKTVMGISGDPEQFSKFEAIYQKVRSAKEEELPDLQEKYKSLWKLYGLPDMNGITEFDDVESDLF